MKQDEFLSEVRKAYIKARKISYKPLYFPKLLVRGTSHSISSQTEDMFGFYCADRVQDQDKVKIHVDPQLSFRDSELRNESGERPLLIRPDVVIVRGDFARCMFDVKTDLGYNRTELYNHAKKRNDQIDSIKDEIAYFKDGQTKVESSMQFAEDIKYNFVVLSQGNIKKKTQDDFIRKIRLLENVDIFLLSTGDHLNSYSKKPDWAINKKDFDRLDNYIDSCLKADRAQ